MKKTRLLSLLLAVALLVTACGGGKGASSEPAKSETAPTSTEAKSDEAKKDESVKEAPAAEGKAFTLHRAYALGSQGDGFIRAVVAMDGDKVLAATLDEFQYMDEGAKGVPNSDVADGLQAGAVAGKVFTSKLANDEAYSAKVKEIAKATLTMGENYASIEAYAAGKTVAELEEVLSKSEPGKPVEAISGATVVSGAAYLQAIVDAAKSKEMVSEGMAADPSKVTLKAAQAAPHGTKSFADVVVALDGDKVAAVSLDEFQYIKGATGVPGSDGKLAEGFADAESPLASKRVNNEVYSKLMADKAKATKALAESYDAIQAFAVGKTVEDLTKVISENEAGKPVDAVTGATLADTVGYLQAIVDTAK